MSVYLNSHVGLPLGNIGSADEFQCLRLSTSNQIALKRSYAGQEFIRILLSLVPRPHSAFHCLHEATESWAGPGNKARSCWLPDTLALFPSSCAEELGGKDYLVYTYASCIAEDGTVLCGLALVMIFMLHFRPL